MHPVVNQFIRYLRIVGMLCSLWTVSTSAQAIYPSNQPIVQVSIARAAIEFIVNKDSSSQSNSSHSANTARGSNVQGAGNVSVTATGVGGTGGDITVQGSNIAAGHTTSLSASGNINLLASQNTTSQTSSSSSRSTSAGPSFNISANRGNSNGAGVEVTNTNSQISGTRVNLNSGGNTTLQGAVVAANTVNADIGGNLNITSLQDTSSFNEASRSQGGSLSISATGVPTGASISSGRSNINSNYASVNEQSGIRAGGTGGPSGSGGFNVNVAGTTTLNGGQITSSQAAVDAGRNTFNSTGGTTITDIQNSAAYSASGSNTALSYTPTVTNADGSTSTSGGAKPSVGFGSARGSANSTTTGGISGVAGNTAARTGDAGTGLAPIFNQDRVRADVQAQIQITQQAVPQLSRAVGDYAAGQMNEARRLQAQANQLPDGDPRRAQLERQANAINDNWGDKGILRLGAHILIGGLAGGSAGAAGSAAGTLSAPFIANGLQQLGITGPLANTLTTIASTGAGALTGRATGTPGGATAGGGTAMSEVTHNYLSHPNASRLIDLQNRCKTTQCSDQDRSEINALLARDRATTAALYGCAGQQTAQCNEIRRDFAIATASYLPTPVQVQAWAENVAAQSNGRFTPAQIEDAYNASYLGIAPRSSTPGDLNPAADWMRRQIINDPNLSPIAMGAVMSNNPSMAGVLATNVYTNNATAGGARGRYGDAINPPATAGAGNTNSTPASTGPVIGELQPNGTVALTTAGAPALAGARPAGAGAVASNTAPVVVPPPNTYPVYPSGSGAATMPLPPGYTTVSRWISPEEAGLWLNAGGNAIPSAVPNNSTQLLYITQAGAPRPAGASGTVRIDFAVPNAMIQPGNTATNNLIIQPVQSTPIYGVQIHVPNGVRIPTTRK